MEMTRGSLQNRAAARLQPPGLGWVAYAFAFLTWACLSCVPGSASTSKNATAAQASLLIEAYPRRANQPVLEVFLPQTKDTVELWESLRDELSDEYDVVPFIMSETTTAAQMNASLRQVRPLCAILVNNPTVRLYQEVQRQAGIDKTPPGFIVMASYLQEVAAGMQNVTGIAYEVPAVTSFVNVRSFVREKITRVGVIRRPAFASYIAKQRELAVQEKFQIVDVVVSEAPTSQEIVAALNALRQKGGIEALWVLNDNALLRQDLIVDGWLEALKSEPMPVVVGVSALVSKDFRFGSFAMLPDHGALGQQVAEMIFELADTNWNTAELGIAQPLSVESVVDVGYARQHFGFREERLVSVDRIVE